jgi:hypothetical protein
MANSFVFDWLIRRVVTTTVNYFILESVPIPTWDASAPWAQALSRNAERLSACAHLGALNIAERQGKARAEIEALVADVYGLSFNDMKLILEDFPQLDRSQTPLRGESSSTVTRDTVLSACEDLPGAQTRTYSARMRDANRLGAKPFTPNHLAAEEGGDDA